MKKFILAIMLLLPISAHAGADEIMQVGEYLKYEVSFLSISLGTIEMTTEEVTDINGNSTYVVKADIATKEGIPFIDLKAVFKSWIDNSMNHSHKFTSNSKVDDDVWEFQQYLYDYDKNNINIKIWENKNLQDEKNLKIKKKYNDGTSLFYVARKYTKIKKSIKIPTIIREDLVDTKINFHGTEENIEIDALEYPVNTIYFDGTANWEGLYGLNGEFEGWFSNDKASVPIMAKMNVYVGSVDIELVEWKRKGWSPPKGKEN